MRTPEPRPALAQLVSDALREHDLSLRTFADRAIDPETGYRLSHSLANKIRTGRSFRPTPRVMRAIAAGARKPLAVVQSAAAAQFLGMEIHRGDAA